METNTNSTQSNKVMNNGYTTIYIQQSSEFIMPQLKFYILVMSEGGYRIAISSRLNLYIFIAGITSCFLLTKLTTTRMI